MAETALTADSLAPAGASDGSRTLAEAPTGAPDGNDTPTEAPTGTPRVTRRARRRARRARLVTTLSLFVGLGIALWAQSLVGDGRRDQQAANVFGAYVAAMALFLLGVAGLAEPGEPGLLRWPGGRARPALGASPVRPVR